MKINKTYQSLIDKSISSMLSAIEIYNKPDFKYREETFSILAINSWELLFKSRVLKLSKYNLNSIFQLEPKKKKNGENSKNKQPKINRAGNPLTISLIDCIKRLEKLGESIPNNLEDSLISLIELRDNAIHFHNGNEISKELQELGFAIVKNFMEIIPNWDSKMDLSKYNFYLMPLAYVDSQVSSSSILTDEVSNYLNFLKKKVEESSTSDENYSVAIGIDINFKKSTSFESIGMKYDENGVAVQLSEEDMRLRFPLDYKMVTDKAKTRYLNFKQNQEFNHIMAEIKNNTSLCHGRQLDPKNPKSSTKHLYSSNIWKELDKYHEKHKR